MSILPRAIERAFALHEGRTLGMDAPHAEHLLRVWEAFRRYRPLGDTPIARYEELGCIALLHDALALDLVGWEELGRDFGPYVAAGVERVRAGIPPGPGDDPDVALILSLHHLDTLETLAPGLDAADLGRRLDEFSRTWLPTVTGRSPELARDLRFKLDALRP